MLSLLSVRIADTSAATTPPDATTFAVPSGTHSGMLRDRCGCCIILILVLVLGGGDNAYTGIDAFTTASSHRPQPQRERQLLPLPQPCQAAAVRTAASSIPSFLLLLVPTQRSRVGPRSPPSLAGRSDQSALLRHELTRADGYQHTIASRLCE